MGMIVASRLRNQTEISLSEFIEKFSHKLNRKCSRFRKTIWPIQVKLFYNCVRNGQRHPFSPLKFGNSFSFSLPIISRLLWLPLWLYTFCMVHFFSNAPIHPFKWLFDFFSCVVHTHNLSIRFHYLVESYFILLLYSPTASNARNRQENILQ